MKNKTRITILLVITVCMFFSSGAMAQETAVRISETTPVVATISKDFVIQLPDEQGRFSSVYLLNFENTTFKTEAMLHQFCEGFSFDFHTLHGNFTRSEITLELKVSSIAARGFSKTFVNQYFEDISKRMKYYFNLLQK